MTAGGSGNEIRSATTDSLSHSFPVRQEILSALCPFDDDRGRARVALPGGRPRVWSTKRRSAPGNANHHRRLVIKADKAVQLRLLDLQAIDTALAQLQHRRKTLPEHAAIAEKQQERDARAEALIEAETAVSDLERAQRRAENDLEPVRDRLKRNEHRIADGTVADPKALAGLIEEVEHLGHRISDLEDAELEIMEQLETASGTAERIRGEVAGLDSVLREYEAKRDQQLVELDADLKERQTERDATAPEIPADLMKLYDRIVPTHGGVGAAELKQRRCTGCRLELNAADLREFAAAAEDEVLRCEECGRILVRTAESGL